MPSPATLLLFAAASAALALIPGPNVLYVLARGLAGGRPAAVRAVLGVHAATACFVAAAACGLTALLVSSSPAFAVVRYAGAAYLIYLGLRSLRPSVAAPAAGQSFLVGISNPKVAVFVAAFLPQFGSSTRALLVLGVVFLLVMVTVDLGWALLAGTLGRARWLRRATGPLYLTLGTYAAVTA